MISFFPSLFSCHSIHTWYFLTECVFESLLCSNQLISSEITSHRMSRRMSCRTLRSVQTARIVLSKADRRWLIKISSLSIDTTETIFSWAEKFSMQMTRMKSVQQDDTEWHRKISFLQQLRVSIQTVLRNAHAYSFNQVAVTSASTDARNSVKLN